MAISDKKIDGGKEFDWEGPRLTTQNSVIFIRRSFIIR